MSNTIIPFYAPTPATPRQEERLQAIFGPATKAEHRKAPRNAALLKEDFEQSGARDCVVVGPMAYLEHVLNEGIQPLWAQMEPCKPDDPAVEVRLPGGRCFKFIEFKRLKELKVEYAGALKALNHTRPAVVSWLSQHAPVDSSKEELRLLYGTNVDFQQDPTEFRDANEVIYRSRNAHDRVVVAPLSVFDDLTKRGIQPIEPKLIENRVLLRRVLGVKMAFDPVQKQPEA